MLTTNIERPQVLWVARLSRVRRQSPDKVITSGCHQLAAALQSRCLYSPRLDLLTLIESMHSCTKEVRQISGCLPENSAAYEYAFLIELHSAFYRVNWITV